MKEDKKERGLTVAKKRGVVKGEDQKEREEMKKQSSHDNRFMCSICSMWHTECS